MTDQRMKMTHPIQPLGDDGDGTVRFKENPIVRYLLDNGGIDLNAIARRGFAKEDQQQFAQLIGYSLSGYSELSYVTDEAYSAASRLSNDPAVSHYEARITALTSQLNDARDGMKHGLAALFEKHPDDFEVDR